ncbi:hypothetical protein OTB20_41415 [Streptomyces sp. H27-H1]|uniref:hypothetical protein n=1 Tax=Streptomyces sp. H27-H1 TaxID=2996461 RepID=UPI0022705778|nr:hypothetical protein [Streptomyces sp. H27-H1]MCY0932487.1 hypothetical protein [Streptomyces sp. H27-H1]
MLPITVVPQPTAYGLAGLAPAYQGYATSHATASAPPRYVPAPVPAPTTVSTPVYEEMVAEWAAFGRYWPGADQYADAAVPAAGPYPPEDLFHGSPLPPAGPWS